MRMVVTSIADTIEMGSARDAHLRLQHACFSPLQRLRLLCVGPTDCHDTLDMLDIDH